MGVHAPDIKEEFKEFKEFKEFEEFEEFWRGAALARAPHEPSGLALSCGETGNGRQAGGSRDRPSAWQVYRFRRLS
jgi:hypothetical protein